MAEWVVGQWVEWRDDAVMVVDMQPRCGLIGVDINGERRWVQEENVNPFAWQIGKTYKTTRDGITATVQGKSVTGSVVGMLGNGVALSWDHKTGLIVGCEDMEGVLHLTPYLADEPSEHLEVERFTVEQRGVDWIVRDNLRGRVSKFRDQKTAEIGCQMMKKGDVAWIWSTEQKPDPAKPQTSSPYDRVIGGVEVDLWTLADIYGITSHRLFSAWKKITMAGRRGPKDKLRDLREARVGLDKEIAKLEAEGGE